MLRLSILAVCLASCPVGAAEKYALVVGVNKYRHTTFNEPSPLQYAEADATEMAKLLEDSGYKVDLLKGPAATEQAMRDRIKALSDRGDSDGIVLVALSGHGLQLEKDEDAYFCPYDARVREAVRNGVKVLTARGTPLLEPDPESCIKVVDIIGRFRLSPAGTRILLADCCRNDPASAGLARGVGTGLRVDQIPNTAILLSCKKGQKSWEAARWGHGAFYFHVLKGLRDGKTTAAQLIAYLEEAVPLEVKKLPEAPDQNPHPIYNGIRLDLGIVTPRKPTLEKSITSPTTNMELIRIKAGTFTMGSPAAEKSRHEDEMPYQATLTKDFYIGQCEVTIGEFKKFIMETDYKTEPEADGKGGYDPTTLQPNSKFTWRNPGFAQATDNHPVVNVTWNDAVKFAEWLSKKEGRNYRLPTEAEWEYACRGGSTNPFGLGDGKSLSSRQANFLGEFPYGPVAKGPELRRTEEVKSYKPNEFGLYNMHGNVREWCSSIHGDYPLGQAVDPAGPAKPPETVMRVVRGGGWDSAGHLCRSALRQRHEPTERYYNLGFRLACAP